VTQPIVVTGTDTGIGKTVFAAALTGALDGYYWKPVQSGLAEETDSETVRRLSGLAADRILPERYRLRTPASPHLAAEIDGVAIDPASLVVRTILNGAERQNYPIADMIFSSQQLVSKISHDMTLSPGDLICCGTSVGVGVMREPVNTVTIAIDGIGELTNEFRQ